MYDYIYLRHAGGVMYVPAVVVESNFNARKGLLFSRFEGVCDANLSGISEGGICEGESLSKSIRVENVDLVNKSGRLVINATLTIQNDDGVRFFGEENEIAKAILGCCELNTNNFEIAVTKDFLKNEADEIDLSRLAERKLANVVLVNSVLKVSSNFSSEVKEVVVLQNGVVVMCFYPQIPVNVKVSAVLSEGAGSVELKENDIVDVFSISVDGGSIEIFELIPSMESVQNLRSSRWKTGKNSKIRSGPLGLNLIINEFGVNLTKNLVPIRSFAGFDGRICANGGVVIFGDKVTIFDGGRERRLEIKAGVRNEAVFAGGIYMIACSDGQLVRIHRVNSADFSVATTTEPVAGVQLFSMFGQFIAGVSATVCRVYTVVGTNSGVASWLFGNILGFDGKELDFFADRLILLSGEDSYWIRFRTWDMVHVDGKICGDIVTKYDGNVTKISSLDEPNVVLSEIDGKIVDISRYGDKIFIIKEDGCVVVQLVNSKKTRLVCDSIMQGSQVSYNVRHKVCSLGFVETEIKIK